MENICNQKMNNIITPKEIHKMYTDDDVSGNKKYFCCISRKANEFGTKDLNKELKQMEAGVCFFQR